MIILESYLNNMNLANKSMEKVHFIDNRRDYFSTGTVIEVRKTYGHLIIDIKRVRVNLPIIDQKKKKKKMAKIGSENANN